MMGPVDTRKGALAVLLGLCLGACGYPHPAGNVDAANGGDDDDAAAIDAPDAWLDCSCSGSTLSCPSGDTVCAATCEDTAQPHCAQLIPSNTVDRSLLSQVSTTITVAATTTIDSGTGAITGGIVRASGTGVKSGILYAQVGNLGVFVFDELVVNSGITLHVLGTRPTVFLVAKTVTVSGIIDASGDQGSIGQPGAGGGAGGAGTTVAGGCGPGGAGSKSGTELSDSGGGGGGGGAVGARGGKAAAENGGNAGGACIPLTLEPLVGGSGGGVGALGTAPRRADGGGGGGALQISSLQGIMLTSTGVIDVGGAGGEGGQGDTSGTVKNAGAGAGGGSGGALLLEAPVVTVSAGAVIAANGGGGGGAGDSATTGTTGGDGTRTTSVATGGAPAGAATKGGNGGAGATAAQQGTDTSDNTTNTGGGGGGVGVIFIRAHTTPTLAGVVSPSATTGAFRAD